jgi:hypothetical protein
METPTFKEKLVAARMRVALVMTSSLALVGMASATEINWTEITTILEGVVDIFPSILTLVVNIFPIIIVISIIGFVIGFLDTILDMVKLR